jgi:hypothetical protein
VSIEKATINDSVDNLKNNSDSCGNTQLKELYDFVYSDDLAEGELSNMFTGIKPCDMDDANIVKCESQPREGEISFCKNEIDNHFHEKALEQCNVDLGELDSTKDGNPIIFKYNESQENMLNGYESFGSSFMLLKN